MITCYLNTITVSLSTSKSWSTPKYWKWWLAATVQVTHKRSRESCYLWCWRESKQLHPLLTSRSPPQHLHRLATRLSPPIITLFSHSSSTAGKRSSLTSFICIRLRSSTRVSSVVLLIYSFWFCVLWLIQILVCDSVIDSSFCLESHRSYNLHIVLCLYSS